MAPRREKSLKRSRSGEEDGRGRSTPPGRSSHQSGRREHNDRGWDGPRQRRRPESGGMIRGMGIRYWDWLSGTCRPPPPNPRRGVLGRGGGQDSSGTGETGREVPHRMWMSQHLVNRQSGERERMGVSKGIPRPPVLWVRGVGFGEQPVKQVGSRRYGNLVRWGQQHVTQL